VIAAQLGIDFNGNTEQIHEAIEDLQREPNRVEHLKLLNELKDVDDFLADLSRQLKLSRPKNREAIVEAIAELQVKAKFKPNDEEKTELINEIREANELIAAIAIELNLKDDFESIDLIRQVKAERQAKECAMLAAKERGASLDAIAEQLGVSFDGDAAKIYDAIAYLKDSNLKMLKDRVKPVKINVLPYLLGEALNLGNVFDDDDVLEAIANLKHSLQLSQKEVDELQEKSRDREIVLLHLKMS
jgi:hypothetical protein